MVRHHATARLVAAALAVAACDTRFVEATPPLLASGTRVFEEVPFDEPLVVGAILDLHVPDADLCREIGARVVAAVRRVEGAVPVPVRELPAVELSPGCAQDPLRTFDATALVSAIRVARTELAGHAVRPVLVYANNTDLALPWGVQSGLWSLRDAVVMESGLEPVVYAVGLAGLAGWSFRSAVTWTYGTDDALWSSVERRLLADLPFRSRAGGVYAAPLLDPDHEAAALFYRVCRVDGVRVTSCGPGWGTPCPLPPSPVASVEFVPIRAEVGRPGPVRASATYEVCTGRCDRFIDTSGGLVRWTELDRCTEGGR